MRHQWRFLLFRNYPRSSRQAPMMPSCYLSQVNSSPSNPVCESFHTLSSVHSHSVHRISTREPVFYSRFVSLVNPRNSVHHKNPMVCNFSSEPAVEQKDSDHTAVSDIFIKLTDANDISKELELSGIVFTHEMVLKVLKNLETSPDVARRFFNWALERDSEKLSSQTYNLMLRILGVDGAYDEFWALVDDMKKKGYGVAAHVRNKMTEKFEKEALESDLQKLKSLFAKGSIDNSLERVSSKVSKIIKSEVWDDDVEKRLKGLNFSFSSDLVRLVVENLSDEPSKALIFFRWVEESGLVKPDERSYNSIARVLGREDCIDRFWKFVDEMRSKGYELETETYVKVLGRLCKRKMVKDAVDLYEFAMAGKNKPSVQCCTFLLRKIVVGKLLDMGLFSKVVKVYKENGNELTDSMVNAVLKALTSVGRFGDCNKILKALEEGGFVASDNVKSKIVFRLSSMGEDEEASEFMNRVEESGNVLGKRTWASLVEGHCVSGEIEKASDCFRKMVEKEGSSGAGYAFDVLVNAYCRKNRAIDACKLVHVHVHVSENGLNPWHSTYKELIKNLLFQGGFNDALSLLGLMKENGFPPFVEPIIQHVSRRGTGDEAIAVLKAMTSKRFPSKSVFIDLFEAFFKAGRHSEAQDFLSKCPGYIRNNADVLDLFYAKKPRKSSAAAVAA